MYDASDAIPISGERFTAVYTLAGGEREAHARAADICIEQTVEFPEELVPAGRIRDHIFGEIESFEQVEAGRYRAAVSYAVEIAGGELTQFLNVVFGNISIKPGIRLERLELPERLLRAFRGPRFGQAGWRHLLGVPERPLLCTALKPMGLSPAQLADMAYNCALGGIDIIKDDHGLADQPFCPFEERVARCADAVARANRETGRTCLYMTNVTAPADRILARATFANNNGAGALLICPGVTGIDAMRRLADDDDVALPIMSHPSFYGGFSLNPEAGVSHYVLYGQLQRLAGADASIYPNYGGRFSFSREECLDIVAGCEDPLGDLKPIFATPGGGMSIESIPQLRRVYGSDVIFLIGGDLHRHSDDLAANARRFVERVRDEGTS